MNVNFLVIFFLCVTHVIAANGGRPRMPVRPAGPRGRPRAAARPRSPSRSPSRSQSPAGPPPGSVIIPASQPIPRPPDIVVPIPNYAAPQQPVTAGPPPGAVIVPANQPLPQPPNIVIQPIDPNFQFQPQVGNVQQLTQLQVVNPPLSFLYTRDKQGRYVPILTKRGTITWRYKGGIYVNYNNQIMNVHKLAQPGYITRNQNRPPPLPVQPFPNNPLSGLMTLTKDNRYKYILMNQGAVTRQYAGGIYVGIVNNGVTNYVAVHKNAYVVTLGRRRRSYQAGPPRRRRRNN